MPGPFSKSSESLYGMHSKKNRGAYEGGYPMDRNEYVRQLKANHMLSEGYEVNPKYYDSLKLPLQANAQYPNQMMTLPRDKKKSKNPKKSKNANPDANENNNKGGLTASQSAISLAMLNSLRSSPAEDNLYESVEMIHYLKTKQLLARQAKTRSVQKSGHSLFDHLRVEQALKEPATRTLRRNSTADRLHPMPNNNRRGLGQRSGNQSPNSSSSSGDEYETFYRPPPKESRKISLPAKLPNATRRPKHEDVANDSDEDWLIPRPLFMKDIVTSKRQPNVNHSSYYLGADESDSSGKSSGSR